MIISMQGSDHYRNGMNNQDFYYSDGSLKMILDGCSSAKYSEVGTRLFVQLFSTLPDKLNPEKFEDNVKEVFEKLLKQLEKWFSKQEELEMFIMDNLLFTILACFETEDSFIVKMFGDGYIVTINYNNKVSYQKYYYGKKPPYIAYKYCEQLRESFEKKIFITIMFSKKNFKNVGVASDGISPIAQTNIDGFDKTLVNGKENSANGIVKVNRNSFWDDVTLVL